MLHGKQILILDDDESARNEVQGVLNFIGENSRVQSYTSWMSQVSYDAADADIGLILLRSRVANSGVHESVQHARDMHGTTPVVWVGESTELEKSDDPSLDHMLVSQLKTPLTYSALNDAIHQAQRFIEAQEFATEQKLKRPSHLFRSLVGTSQAIKSVRTMMAQVAEKDVTVLIEGESGTGKEVVARNLHYHSSRREGPFVAVNCGAIPAELLESELFGHEKGAFTGAVSSRAGRFGLAENGTLFLDEIGDTPLSMQVKLLRVLQERTYERVGGNKTCTTNARIITATHRNLAEMIEEEQFREDLYYRINVFPIGMPALREREEDVPLLINELVARLGSEGRGSIRFNSDAILSLCRHPWPGNVRELANLVERMAIIYPNGVIGVQELPEKYRHVAVGDTRDGTFTDEQASQSIIVSTRDLALLPDNDIDLREYISSLEQSLIQQALDSSDGVVARAAKRLMIRRTTLVEKIKKYGMQRP